MVAHLREAFPDDTHIAEIRWDADGIDWSAFDAVLIGTTWDYQDRLPEFLRRMGDIAAQTQLFNPLPLVKWNTHKSYLRDLGERGAPIIPTLWIDEPDTEQLRAAFDHFADEEKLVFKRQVGANATGQHRLTRGEPMPEMPEPVMVQPFLPAIASEGEYSFVFIDGDLSHAVIKRAVAGEYRIQSDYGGTHQVITPDPADLAIAQKIIALCDTVPLYARVDMVRGEDGGLLLMELELVEPFLYVEAGVPLGAMLHAALRKRFDG